MKTSYFPILSGWIEKYKPPLIKSDSSWDNSYCVRLVIVSLAVNIGKLQTHFIFKGKFYNQIDGVAVGSPLAPVLANIFMSFYESKWLNEYNLNKPKFYLKYVDHILAAFDKEQDS